MLYTLLTALVRGHNGFRRRSGHAYSHTVRLLTTALAYSVFAAPAHAFRARVYVSKAGADIGACSLSAQCQSLGYALSGVEPGGEITILDSGGYNPITITQGVTITVPPGVEPSIAVPSGGTGITINEAEEPPVVLRGLTLRRWDYGLYGIYAAATGGRVEIVNCTIHNFTQGGIYIVNNTQAVCRS